MLSYERELELSDRLVARRPVVEALKVATAEAERMGDEVPELSTEDALIVSSGLEAANEIVEEYLPFIRSISSNLYYRNNLQNSMIEFDDLVQEGAKAAISCTNAFDARGKGEHPGRRFSGYSEMMIRKTIKRFIDKQSTPMNASVDLIQNSYRWYAVRQELQIKLGRQPTDAEIQEILPDINPNYIADIPRRSSFINLDDPDRIQSEESHIGNEVSEDEHHNLRLREALADVRMNEEFIDAIILYFGCDRGLPRTVDEVARDMDIGLNHAKRLVSRSQDMLIHPQYRVLIARAVEAAKVPQETLEGAK